MSMLGLDARGPLLWMIVGVALTASLRLQEQEYRERQVLDPATDEWVTAGPDEVAGPMDELGEARALLARGEEGRARSILNRWLKQNPDDERVDEATFLVGETYFEGHDYWQAVKRYQTVAENASGPIFDAANQRATDVGRAFLAGEKRILWYFIPLPAYDDGIEILDRVWERVPGSRLGELALKYKADYYFANGDMDLAYDEYVNLAQQYPSGRFTQVAMLRSAEAAESEFPGVRFDDQPLIDANERYRQFAGTFPVYAEREKVPERLEGIRQQRAQKDYEVARWYERTRQPGAAEFYYRLILKDWPETLAAAEARTRLRALGAELDDAGDAPEERK
jgi:outer membrane protein assembly factor BamD (BamD/ComL family)